MKYKKYWSMLFFAGFVLLLVGVSQLGFNFSRAEAQCGSQESSCKSCHEVQAQAPVNSDGTNWHEAHAFGDFCYLCHAGNQQATEKEAAHTGMVPPLSDIDASCKLCHADDLQERAKVYAVTLGIDLNSSDAANQAVPTSASVPNEATLTTTSEPLTTTQSDLSMSVNNRLAVDDPNLVDYAKRYDEIVLGKHPTNWGNIILVALIALLVVGGGSFIVVNELHMTPATQTVQGEYPVDVIELLPVLSKLKVQTRTTLRRLLTNPQKTEKVLGLIDAVVSDPAEKE